MNITPVKYQLSIVAALTTAVPAAVAQNARSDLEEIVVIGQGIGLLHLYARNGA